MPLLPEALVTRHVDQIPCRQAAQACVRRLRAGMHTRNRRLAGGNLRHACQPLIGGDVRLRFDARKQR